MSGGFQVGDAVECIRSFRQPIKPRPCRGGVYRILEITPGRNPDGSIADGLIVFPEDAHNRSCWNPDSFRKIEAPDTEVARQIRACRPVHDPVSV